MRSPRLGLNANLGTTILLLHAFKVSDLELKLKETEKERSKALAAVTKANLEYNRIKDTENPLETIRKLELSDAMIEFDRHREICFGIQREIEKLRTNGV